MNIISLFNLVYEILKAHKVVIRTIQPFSVIKTYDYLDFVIILSVLLFLSNRLLFALLV